MNPDTYLILTCGAANAAGLIVAWDDRRSALSILRLLLSINAALTWPAFAGLYWGITMFDMKYYATLFLFVGILLVLTIAIEIERAIHFSRARRARKQASEPDDAADDPSIPF